MVDAALESPLDRLATPSWAAHHEAAVRDACHSTGSSVIVAENDDGQLTGFVAFTVHPKTPGMSEYGEITVLAAATLGAAGLVVPIIRRSRGGTQ